MELVPRTMMDAIKKLHLLAHRSMAGDLWPADHELCASIDRFLRKAGLLEAFDAHSDRFVWPYSTEVELLLSCVGVMSPMDVPFFLESHGYISEDEASDVWEAKDESEALRRVKKLVARAYEQRFVPSNCRH